MAFLYSSMCNGHQDLILQHTYYLLVYPFYPQDKALDLPDTINKEFVQQICGSVPSLYLRKVYQQSQQQLFCGLYFDSLPWVELPAVWSSTTGGDFRLST